MRGLILLLFASPVAALRVFPRPHLVRTSKLRLCAADSNELDAADVSGLYASLQKRRSQLTSRADAAVRERALIAELAEAWPAHERAQNRLWQHWFGEEGEAARDALQAADGKAVALTALMDEFPDWAEPTNRLATLRYMEGEFAESVQLCLRVLRQKPWHFGASSGIVMCYVKLAEEANVLRQGEFAQEANKWAKEAMPQPGPEREKWVQRMLQSIDAKLAEISEISEA